jgi:hypothetical protein
MYYGSSKNYGHTISNTDLVYSNLYKYLILEGNYYITATKSLYSYSLYITYYS